VLSPPLWLLAELTYRCPLHCVYCSNPLDYHACDRELTTAEWIRVLREARAAGAVQLGLSGGEPLARGDLEIIVGEARALGFYSNLITSGVGLDQPRAAALRKAGLDHVQLSFQDSTRELNDFLSHSRTFDLKLAVARTLKAEGYPIVLNVVLHRHNLDHIEKILEMAQRLEVDFLELANVQFYGWALLNRAHLLPTADQLARAEQAVQRFRARHGEQMRIYFVVADYHERRPKRCMNGWGAVFMVITPDGLALPCHQARIIPHLQFPSVRDFSIPEIWNNSAAFNHFRGDAWVREPCRSCPEWQQDRGGCRCQAWLLTGDAAATDPVCELAPGHDRVVAALNATAGATRGPLRFRDDAASRQFIIEARRARHGR